MTILNIDDDQDDLDIFCDAIQVIDPNIKCLISKTPEEAFKIFDEDGIIPDYIFCDINMPLINGLECLKELRNRSQLAKVPVIMFSTSASHLPDKKEYEKLGAQFLTKPTRYLDLVKSIKKITNR